MPHTTLIPEPWDDEGFTILYATADEGAAMTMIEIRANVTGSGWNTIAFIEAIWPDARLHARLIASAPRMLEALRAIAADPDACTCHTRGWYGELHDTQCPVRIALDTLSQAART